MKKMKKTSKIIMAVGLCAVLTAALTVAFSIQNKNDEDMAETTTVVTTYADVSDVSDVETSVPESTSSPASTKAETKSTTKRRSINNSVVSAADSVDDNSHDEVVAVRSNDEAFENSVSKAKKEAEAEASKAADEIPDAEEIEIVPKEASGFSEQNNTTVKHKGGKYSSMHGSV